MFKKFCCLLVFMIVFACNIVAGHSLDWKEVIAKNVHGGEITEKLKEAFLDVKPQEFDDTSPSIGLFNRLESIDASTLDSDQNRDAILNPLALLQKIKSDVLGEKAEGGENIETTSTNSDNDENNLEPFEKLENTAGEFVKLGRKDEDIDETTKTGKNSIKSVENSIKTSENPIGTNENPIGNDENPIVNDENSIETGGKPLETDEKTSTSDEKSSATDEKSMKNTDKSKNSTPFFDKLTNTAEQMIDMNKIVKNFEKTTKIDAKSSETDEEFSKIDEKYEKSLITDKELPEIQVFNFGKFKSSILENSESSVGGALEGEEEGEEKGQKREERDNKDMNTEREEKGEGVGLEEVGEEVKGTKGLEEEANSKEISRTLNDKILNAIKTSIDLWGVNSELAEKDNSFDESHEPLKLGLDLNSKWDINSADDDKKEENSSSQATSDDQSQKNDSKNSCIFKRGISVAWSNLKVVIKLLLELLRVYCNRKNTSCSENNSGMSENRKLYLPNDLEVFDIFDLVNNKVNSQKDGVKDGKLNVVKMEQSKTYVDDSVNDKKSFFKRMKEAIIP